MGKYNLSGPETHPPPEVVVVRASKKANDAELTKRQREILYENEKNGIDHLSPDDAVR